MRRIWYGIAGGLLGGATVGVGEALWILGGASTGEYVAMIYAVVLYAMIGVGMGAPVGVGLLVLGKLWKGLPDALAWMLGYLGVVCPLGLVIARYVVNKAVYLEKGVPMSGMLVILGVFGLIFLLGLWLGSIFLTRTPLKVLLQVKGTVALYGAMVLLAAVFSFGTGAGDPDGQLAAEKDQSAVAASPNVLLIMVDTLRADYIGAYGRADGITPHMDDLAADGVVFEQPIAHASWTRASTASLFSSMLPHQHKTDVKVSVLPSDVDTIAEVLGDQGYATGGLPNNINVTRSFNFQQGFDYFSYQAPTYIAGATESASQLSMYNVVRKVRDRLTEGGKRVEDYYQPAPVVLGNSQRFITANKDRRWFLFAHLMEPHDPYFERTEDPNASWAYNGVGYGRAEHEVPESEKVEYLKQTYATEIKAMDADLGRFIDWLKSEDLYDNTVIIITADHGEEFLEHGGWWHGTTLYDEQIRIPLVVKLPNNDRAGQRVPWQVRQVDIAPTISELAQVPASDKWQGNDLFDAKSRMAMDALAQPPLPEPAAGDQEPAVEDEEGAGQEAAAPRLPMPDIGDHHRVALSEEDFEGNVLSSVRTGSHKYIRANEGNPRGLQPEELYEVASDPLELSNIAGREGELQAGLSEKLRELLTGTGPEIKGETKEISCEECQNLQMLGYMDDCTASCGG